MMSNKVDDAKRRARASRSSRSAPTTTRNSSNSERMMMQVFKSRAGKLPMVIEEEDVRDRENRQNYGNRAKLVPKKGFFFQQRHGHVDLRRIAAIDVDRLVEEVDIETLQGVLENITFAELDERDVRTCTDEQFVKLFRMTQLTIEYLLNVQHTLFSYSSTLEAQMVKVEREHSIADQKLMVQDEQIQSIKRELKQKKRTLKTYEFLLTQRSARETSIPQQMEISAQIGSPMAHASPREDAKRELEIRKKILEDQQKELREQAETMRKVLQQEAEAMKQQLLEEIEEQKRQQALREEQLQERELQFRKQLEQQSAHVERNQKRSLAGSALEDDVEEEDEASLRSRVNDLLGVSTAPVVSDQVNAELSKLANENSRLREELNLVLEANKSILSSQKQPKEEDEKEKTNTVTLKAEHDENLMLRLAQSHVSRELADQRSMQLRRVLRIVRRRLQHQSFSTWRMVAVRMAAKVKEERLLREMESLRRRTHVNRQSYDEDDEDSGDEDDGGRFVPEYHWKTVPVHVESLDTRLEVREMSNGIIQARIPRTWFLETEWSLGKIKIPVEKNMTVLELRKIVAEELEKPFAKVFLKFSKSGVTLLDSLTVQSADLFHQEIVVQIKTKTLDERAIQGIVKDYTKDIAASMAEELSEPSTKAYSPIPDKPQIRAKWFHSQEEIEAVSREIDEELSRSIGSTSTHSKTRRSNGSGDIATTTPKDRLGSTYGASAFGDNEDDDYEDDDLDGTFASATPTPARHQEQSVPVNFGDYESSVDGGGGGKSDHLESSYDESSVQSEGKPPKLKIRDPKSQISKEIIARRHKATMERFSKVGLVRRAQINTLNLSDDSGSSRTVTSVSSASRSGQSDSVDFLAKSGQSHFDVMKKADQYDKSSNASNASDLEYTQSTAMPPGNNKFNSTVSQLLDEMEDDSDDSEP